MSEKHEFGEEEKVLTMEELRLSLLELEVELYQTAKGRNLHDIVPNLRSVIQTNLTYLAESTKAEFQEELPNIMIDFDHTRTRVAWLKEHPEFSGDLIALRKAMGEE